MTTEDHATLERLQQRLQKSLKVLRELRGQYPNDPAMYSDQIATVKAVEEHIAAVYRQAR